MAFEVWLRRRACQRREGPKGNDYSDRSRRETPFDDIPDGVLRKNDELNCPEHHNCVRPAKRLNTCDTDELFEIAKKTENIFGTRDPRRLNGILQKLQQYIGTRNQD